MGSSLLHWSCMLIHSRGQNLAEHFRKSFLAAAIKVFGVILQLMLKMLKGLSTMGSRAFSHCAYTHTAYRTPLHLTPPLHKYWISTQSFKQASWL